MLNQFTKILDRPMQPIRLAGEGRFVVKTLMLCLFPLFLYGCMSTPSKLPDTARTQIKKLKLVAMEVPPLEIAPDLLETRMPVYAHYDNMVLPVAAETKLYRLPGNLLISGLVGEGDPVALVEPADLAGLDPQSSAWRPSSVLSQESVIQLNAGQVRTIVDRRLGRLPLTQGERDADVVRWHDAVEQWYERDKCGGDAGRLAADSVDAILEVGIGQYKIYAGQLSIQLFIKLIDPKSARVIARTVEKSTAYEAPVETLLANGGAKFKMLFRQRTARLLAQGFQTVGLTAIK